MLTKLEELKDGHLYRPSEVAPFLPGNSAKRVRAMCQDGELTYTPGPGRAGGISYWISGKTVKEWRIRNTTKAA